MGKCSAVYRELRFVLAEGLAHAYVALEAVGDCPIGVAGWHHKAFAAEVSAMDILNRIANGSEDPILWDQAAP